MSKPKRIVCIDDEPQMIELMRIFLGQKGHEALGALSGREGMDLILREKPDLILLDLMMPDEDGWQVYQKLKASESLRDIPVIIVSAKSQQMDILLAKHIAKVDGYVTKPFNPQDLLAAIDEVIAQRESARAA